MAQDEETTEATPTAAEQLEAMRHRLRVDYKDADATALDDPPRYFIDGLLGRSLKGRLEKLFEKTTTEECRRKIVQHLSYFVNAIGKEESLPFADYYIENRCNETVYADWENLPDDVFIGDIQNRTYQPPRNESRYLDDPSELILLYGILTHDDPDATIRLIEALYEPGHLFVVHVDAKYEETQTQLLEYASSRSYIFLVQEDRVRVNWGGFSMVNATLQMLKVAHDHKLDYHQFVHISASSYPIASNWEIRKRLSDFPLDTNFMNVIMRPTRPPTSNSWHYFIECDDSLHRIYQLERLRGETHGINLFTSSQWFILSHEFATYLANMPSGSMVEQYLKYIEHVVVADETFFGTVLRNTEFCHKHHNQNFMYLHFDRWESDLPQELRDTRKCPMPDPNHCGRSPTTMTLDYADILELSTDLFARKFDDKADSRVKDVIDSWRAHRTQGAPVKSMDFEGQGVLIVAKDTVNDPMPLCMAIGEVGNKIQLLPCFHEWVPATLADGWERGGVILAETPLHARWQLSPCTTDGELERLESGMMNVTLGNYSLTGPRCMLQQMDGLRAGRCMDTGALTFQPGGETQVYPCFREWYQFVSFGDGRIAPKGSMFTTIPNHIVKQIHHLGHDQIPYMCLGVYERGELDELDWEDEEYEQLKQERRLQNNTSIDTEWEDLSEWKGESIVTTQCSNLGAIIEWAFVPFLDEENAEIITPPDKEGTNSVTSEPEADVPDDNEL